MKRNKKLLISFLAINAILTSYTAQAASTPSVKYEKMYNNVVKNIEKGNSNEKTYQTIQRILNQKNKELKDLYLQGDYIVKPEYLEWQVFFTGFYEEYNEGVDNSKENARYHSKITGYYDASGNYVTTSDSINGMSGKPYQPLQQPKDINLGVSIPLKGMSREPLTLALSPANEINVTPSTLTVTAPTGVSIPSLSFLEFQPLEPVVELPQLVPIPIITIGGAGGGNGGYTGFYPNGDPNGNAIISQMNVNSGEIYAHIANHSGTGGYGSKVIYDNYRLTNLTGGASPGLTISGGGQALPAGTYNSTTNTSVQGIFKVVDNAITRYGIAGSNPDDLKITLEGDDPNPVFLGQILHYDEHYLGTQYTLNGLETQGWITAAEKTELADKFLDTVLGHTTANRLFQYVENNSTWNLKGSSIVAVNLQAHSGNQSADSIFMNRGKIIGLNEASTNNNLVGNQVAFMFTEGVSSQKQEGFDNTGLIEMRAPGSVVYLMISSASSSGNGKHFLMNNGDIKLYGRQNVGVYTRAGTTNLTRTEIKLYNPITVLGDESIGVDIERVLNFANSKVKVDVGTEDPKQTVISPSGVSGLENSGHIANTGYSNQYTDNAIGMYINLASTFTLNDYEIKLGQYSQKGIGVRIENGNLTLGSNMLDTTTKHSLISDGGIGNILIAGIGSSSSVTTDVNTVLEVKNGKSQVGMYANTGSHIINAGTLNAGGDGTKGIVVDTASSITNSGVINVSGGVYTDSSNNKSGSVGVAVKDAGSSFISSGSGSSVTVDVTGKESTGLFADTGVIDITNGTIKTSGGAFNLYSKGSTGKIKLTNVNMETGQRSLLFYNENGGTFELNNVNATIKGAANSNDRGTAFYYVGSGTLPTLTTADLSTYFTSVFNNTANNLTLNMESGSRLFIVDNVSIDLSVTATPLGSISGGPVVTGSSDYKTYMMYKSLLNINQGINLDNPADAYNNLEIATSSITNSGQSITGNNTGQVAMGQENGLNAGGTPLPRSTVSLTNIGGNIVLNGATSVGMYASYGELRNTALSAINMNGNNSIGIYGANGSLIDNQAGSTIKVSNFGVGVYAEGYKQGTAQSFGDGKINVINNGLIQAGTSSNAMGIYANNNSTGNIADALINLGSGTVDMGASENAVGVYVNKGTVSDSASTITVGKNGIALYAKDSSVTLSGTTINLNGDNALGIYLDGNTSFTGNGNINISGQNVVLFNMNTSGTVSNNFNVSSVAPGSTYTLGNITGGVFEYTGNSTLASNGTLVSGNNSAIYLNGSTVTAGSGSTNVAAVALNGQYAGALPVGMTAGTDGENNGTIILGDSSVGLYGKNDSRLSNKSIITVGNASAGLMTSGANSFVLNSGTITAGTGSQGIYLKNGTLAHNMSSGHIVSAGTGTIGIYADNSIAATMQVTNDGNIDLTGDKSIGIYTAGTNNHLIDNNLGATLKVGDSSNVSDPSIGIYSAVAGSTVTNSGTITSGINSIGIYNNQGATVINGTAVQNVGDSGVGIYSTGGIVNLNAGSAFNMGTNGAAGVYGVYSAVNNSTNLNIGNSNYGFILKGGSLTNAAGTNSSIGSDSVYMYSTEGTTVTNDGTLIMSGANNVGFYMAQDPASGIGGAVMVNNASGIITGTAGNNNVGIYNYGGTVDNFGTVAVGNSDIVFISGTTDVDVQKSKYSVGIYGENAAIVNHAGANVSAGYGGYGIVAKGGTASNFGTVTTTGDYSTGMYTENGVITNESGGIINVSGNNTIGMAGKGSGSQIINHGTINITGNDAIGMYGNLGTIITNTGTINISGLNSQIFVSSDPSDPGHSVGAGTATINGGTTANVINSIGSIHALPALINAGIIKSNGVLALEGVQVMIKPDPTTAQPSSDPDYDFELSGTSIIADEILASKPIVILPGFSDGTIADVYKLEGLIKASSGQYDFISGSLLWEATPRATGTGADIYMSRKSFTNFTDGLWFEDFGTALENNFLSASGDAAKIYNKTAYIPDEKSFRHIMASLAGNVYANINQREDDIANAFEDSLHLLQNSENNTKENVKISVIAGKGKNKEETDGVSAYDYTTTGVLALREVERTYRHTFGYSLGYLHTGFEFKDGNESEEWVDTIQLGVHNKYNADSWTVRNDLTGRASIHNVDRNIDWPSPLGRSEMNGTYETYSITSDNILGKEFGLGKKASIMPYGAFRAMYVTRPSFSESGLEALEVEGNDAWSAKPRAGVELKGALPLGVNTAWQLKGVLDIAYEYELADLNEREKARLIAIEDGYHKLSKPQDEKGAFRTRASLGVEVVDRYGIFLTGEYSTGNDKENDYRAGVTLKAVF